MPSLKIDIIVDDKGRPIIDKTTASMRELGDTAHSAGAKTSSAGGELDLIELGNPGFLDGETVTVRECLKVALRDKFMQVGIRGRA